MKIKNSLSLCLVILLLTSCSLNSDSKKVTPSPTIEIILPPTPTVAPTLAFLPLPSDTNLQRIDLTPDNANLLIMQSNPVQVNLELQGSLPTPCYQLRVNVQPVNAQNQVLVEVYSVVDPAAICAQVIQEYEVTVPLGSFPTGHYSVLVNSTEIGQFDS